MATVSLVSKHDYGTIYSLKEKGFPKNSYIICSGKFRRVLYRPQLAGKKLQDAMEDAGEVFVRVISQLALKGEKLGSLVELVYLSGGLFYNIPTGFKRAHGFAIPQCFIGIQRVRIEGTEGEFSARVGYENFEALPQDAVVIIGDTIATGATMFRGLQSLANSLDEKGIRMKKLVVCTLAGSPEGARKIQHAHEKLAAAHPWLETYFFAGEQLFTLMPDGTDLRFLEHESIMPEETRKFTLSEYGEWLGRNMKCAVFDWGTRCKNPKKHYHEFIEFTRGMAKAAGIPKEARDRIMEMEKEAEAGLAEFEKKI
ncbi:MAG: hypothetical protein WC506_06795 [Candidatus Micrarchaeia archaeon]